MNKALFFIFIFCCNFTFAATKVLMPTEKLPRELIYLTESLQELQIKDIEKTRDNDETFKKLSKEFQNLTKEELYFISKSEVYKTVLKFRPTSSVKEEYYKEEILEKISEKLSTTKINSFTHWLIKGIVKDIKDIFSSRAFPTFVIERKKGVVSSSSSRKVLRKLNFLLPWIQSFMTEDTGLFELSLLPMMNEILKKISEKIGYLALYSTNDSKNDEEIKYFEEQTIQLDKSGKPVTVEDILDPLLGKYKNKNLPIPVDDWIQDEDDFAKTLTPIKNLAPTEGYRAPEKLPDPVEEW